MHERSTEAGAPMGPISTSTNLIMKRLWKLADVLEPDRSNRSVQRLAHVLRLRFAGEAEQTWTR